MISKLRFLLKYAHQYRWWYTGGILFMALTIGVSVTIPEYIQKSIDLIGQGREGNENAFYNYVLMILVLALVLILVRTMSRILFFIPGRLIEKQLKGEMFRKLTSFGKEYFDKNSSGSIISRINNDINGVRMITGFGLMQIGNVIFSLSVTPYKMWNMSPVLTLYCVLPLIVVFVIVRVGMAVMVKNTRRRMDSLQNLSGKTVSFLSGNGVIKSYNIHKWAEEKVDEENVSLFDFTMNIARVRSFVLPLLANLEQILKIVVLFAGGMFVINGTFTIGQLAEFIAYAALLSHPIMGLGWVLTVFQQGFVGITSLQTIMDKKGVDDDKPALEPSKVNTLFKQGVSVRNLSYRYHNGDEEVLKNISFDIKPGQVVGITGKLGCGKTTLVNCLNGYLKPEKNSVFFNGHDAALLRGQDIRKVVKTVSQEVFLFSDTIENNITFGSGDLPDNEKVDKVIYKSALADEIERFPGQERTMVGEKGIMLSGGQKQRISLARALYTKSDLLILDDVFSAVDTDTERFLIKHIFENRTNETILVVSNRISVLEKADFIIVLEDGEMVAKGTHKELMKKSSYYRETSELQDNKE
ncbi:ABC transporter ATP-binding protein [Alkalitalea saponilacus]|uniref:ATP-binding cassette, subfamily B n=1 Tax=Alkalitalea saponilacus TaxID=889453 RepID=A0A1T5HSH4_9BACT|nr:ABC transporter ATP-binding protein [Alkalitalea saponilacus]ASB47716.1 ABC transporter ATP-binding protein [Alkalitalea saponilacus]SKC23643.1 ATP-binding cassette, subfamily B [Alkalitalea saponilacus]